MRVGLTSVPAAPDSSRMGIFKRRHNVQASVELATPFPTTSELQRVVIADLLGVRLEDIAVTRAGAMSVPVIAKARNLICNTIARSPLILMRDTNVMPISALLAQPEGNPQRPRFVTLSWTVDELMFYGVAWWVSNRRDATGRTTSVEWIPRADGVFDDRGQLTGTKDGRTFAARDVIRIDGPHEGILAFGKRPINQALLLDKTAQRVANNPMPALNLHDTGSDPMGDDEIDKLISRWVAARTSENGSVAYTSKRIEATAMPGMSVEQLIIEGRKDARLDLTRMMNVPAWVSDIGVDGSSLTYSNVASRSRELVDFGLMPYMTAIAERLSLDDVLPHGQWARFDVDEMLRPDFGDRMAGYKTAIDAGIYTAEELRARELGIPLEESEVQ